MKKPVGSKPSIIPGGTLDDGLQSLLADINATVLDLERKIGGKKPSKAIDSVTPDAPSKQPEPAPEPQPAVIPQEAGTNVPDIDLSVPQEPEPSLLEELESELAQRCSDVSAQPDWVSRANRIHAALEMIFKFFNAFSQQANKLSPEIKRHYPFDSQSTYSRLRWHGAFADYRRESIHENARLAHVAFRVRLIAPEPVPVFRRWNQIDSLRQELGVFNLRPQTELPRTPKAQQERIEVLLAPDFMVQIKFQANYQAGRIEVLCSNLGEFGATAFALEADQVSPKFLDDLGRFLLCRSNTLPPALRLILYPSSI